MYKLSFLLIPILAYGCGNNIRNSQNSVAKTDTTDAPKLASGAPVETQKPNTDYKPALTGQTRIAGAHTSTPYEGKMISSDLKRPWGITALPDGRLLITEKAGTIATTSGTLGAPIINNSSARPEIYSYGHRNVQGLALHPQTGELWQNEMGPRGGDEVNIIELEKIMAGQLLHTV